MKLAVLGASGGCGREVVAQALSAGHDVVGVGRESSDLDHVPEDAIRRGAVDDVKFLAGCFAGVDVVVSCLGLRISGLAPWASVEDPTLLRRVGPAIATAAAEAGVRRILAVSAGGVGDSRARMPLFFRALIAMSSMRKVYPELERFEQALFDGKVEAMCVRPTGLTDGPRTGEVVIARTLVGQASISRADVAAYMLAHLEGPLPEAGPVITVTGAGEVFDPGDRRGRARLQG